MEEKREEGDTQHNQSSDDQSSNMVDNKNNNSSIKSSSSDSQDQDSNVVENKNSNTSCDDNKVQHSNIVDNKNNTIKGYSDDSQDQDSNVADKNDIVVVQDSNMFDNKNNTIKSYSDDSEDQDSIVVEKNDSSCSSKSCSGDGKLESKTSEIPPEQEKQNSSNGGDEAQEDASSMVADDSEETKISESAADVEEQEKKKNSGGIEAQEDDTDSTLVAGDSGKTQELYDPPHDNKGQHPEVGTVKDQSEDDTELKNNSLPSITDKDAYTDERKTSTSDQTKSIQDSFGKIVDDTSTKEVSDDVAIDIPPDTSTHDVFDCVAIDIPPHTSTQDVSASSSSNNDLETSKGFPNEGLQEVEEQDLKACIPQEDMGSQQEIQNQLLSGDVDTGDPDSTSDSAQMETSRSTTENESVKEHVPDIPDHQNDADSKSSQSELVANALNVQLLHGESEEVTADTMNTSKGQGNMEGSPSLTNVNFGTEIPNLNSKIADDMGLAAPECSSNATAGESSSSQVISADVQISDSIQEDLAQVNVENVPTDSTPGSHNATPGDPSSSQVISTDIPVADSCKDLVQVNVENVQTESTPESHNATTGEPTSIYADIANADSSIDLVQVNVENAQIESTPESHNTTAGESSNSQVIFADIPISDSCKEDTIQENVQTESTLESQAVIVEVGSAAVSDVVSGTISSANENNSDELEHQDGYEEGLEVSAATDNVDSLIQHTEGERSKANQNHEDPDTDINEVGFCSHNAQNILEHQTAPSVSTLPCDPAPVILDLSEISSLDNNDHKNTQKSHLEISDQPVDENKLCEGSTETVVGDKTAYTVTPKTETKQMEGGKAAAEPHEDDNAGICHHDAQNVSFEEHQTQSLGMQASGQESFNLDNSQRSGQSLQPDIEVTDSTSQKDTVKKQQHSVSDDADPSESGLTQLDTPPAPSTDTQASKQLPDPKSAAKDDIPTEKKPPTVPVRDSNPTETKTKTKRVSNLSEIVEEEPSASQGSIYPERKGKGKSWLPFKCCQFDESEDDDNDDKAIH